MLGMCTISTIDAEFKKKHKYVSNNTDFILK